jgi:hypothetical protein
LLINHTQSSTHAALFNLVGSKSNRAAIGARVTVTTGGGLKQINEVRSGGSYLSQNDLRLHFGLGKETSMTSVEISWPSGKKETYHDLGANFIYTIVESSGIAQRTPLSGQQVPGESATKPVPSR